MKYCKLCESNLDLTAFGKHKSRAERKYEEIQQG
jgi:hypothetical protein